MEDYFFTTKTSLSRTDAHSSGRVPASWCRGEEKGNKSVCLTYIVEKGEYSQAVGFISGFVEALVLVRIVMDDVELKDK